MWFHAKAVRNRARLNLNCVKVKPQPIGFNLKMVFQYDIDLLVPNTKGVIQNRKSYTVPNDFGSNYFSYNFLQGRIKFIVIITQSRSIQKI
jgi:hypothetical protein